MRRQVLIAATPLLLLAGTLAACSDDGADRADGAPAELGDPVAEASTGSDLDPCALLSVADIDRLTGTTLPQGEVPDEHDADGWEICNWEDPAAAAAIQVQVHRGDGRADFEHRRHELGAGSGGPTRDVQLTGADEAFDSVDQGTVGALVGEHFLQVVVIGGSFDDQHHLALAEAAIEGLDR